ncbi:MAG: Xaa-Pro peptidase family protein [Casimicrobiaceae bacterium]
MDNQVGNRRIERLQRELRERGISALIVMKPENSFYLSGFNPILYSHPVVAILPANGDPVVLVHALRDDHARASAWTQNIRLYGAWSTKKTMGPNWLAALQQIVGELGAADGVLGFEGDWLPVARFNQFREAFPKAKWEDVADVIEHARLVKDEYELECARIAARIADAGMDAALAAIGRRASEREVAIAAQERMNRLWLTDYPDIEVADFGSLEGGAHNGLWCWCLSGERVLVNTDNPTLRKPQEGEIAVIFIWTNCNGMHSENERAVAIGALPAERKAAYDAILTIRERVAPLLQPGARCADVYQAAKEEYVRLGFAPYVPGRIGHGIGLGAHEHLSLDSRSDVVLAPGMMMTFEPNLRIPEWGGMQHSDTLVITPQGHEFLTTTQRGYIQV